MKPLLAMAALPLLVATSAQAHKQQVYVVQIDGTCDTITLTNNKALVLYATTHIVGCVAGKQTPSSNPIPGVGIVVKRNPGSSQARDLAVTDTQPDGSGLPVAYITKLEYPLVTGGAWTAYATSDGKTIAPVAVGTYTVK
jgi:hypothetical protein